MSKMNKPPESTSDPTDIECLNEYVLIKVFNFLSINDKLTCTKVCRRWQRILNSTICQPKSLSITVNSNVPIKELNNFNCDHSTQDQLISEQLTINLVDYVSHNLFYNELLANLNLLILNLIFCDYSPMLDLSQLACLKYLEVHGDYYEFRPKTIYASVKHLFVEKLRPSLFEHFPNLKCLCLNQLKLNRNDPDAMSDESDDEVLYTVNSATSSGLTNEHTSVCSESRCEKATYIPHYQLGAVSYSLTRFKVNYVPVVHSSHSNDLMQAIALITPNLEQIYISFSFCENHTFDSEPLEENELDSKINANSSNVMNHSNDSTVPNIARTNCTMSRMIGLVRRLKKLKLIEIEFDLDNMTSLNSVNSFLLAICNELSQLKLKLRTHLKFTKSLDLNSSDVFEFANFLKTSYANQSNEIIINGKCFALSELKTLLKYYHLINVEELYITNKDLALFRKPTIYSHLSQVNTLCFEANPGVRLNEILTNLKKVKYLYFDCPAVSQEQLNLIPILRPNLEYLAVEEFSGGPLDLELAFKFNNSLRSLYLGKIERINIAQLAKLIEQSKNLTYLNIECRLLGKSLDRIVKLFACNAQQSINFYHLNLSLCDFQFNSFELDNMVKSYKIPNFKISFYQP